VAGVSSVSGTMVPGATLACQLACKDLSRPRFSSKSGGSPLRENALLREPLRAEQVKDRLLGHWGTCPGINLVYAHLNRVILRDDLDAMLITGPGHAAPANLANLYLESSLSEFYPELTHDAVGVEKFVREFSWPGGFPSH